MLAAAVLAVLGGISVPQVQRARGCTISGPDGLLAVDFGEYPQKGDVLAPVADFGLMAQLVTRMIFETMLGLSGYVGAVFLELAAFSKLYLLIVAICACITP